MSFAHTWKVTQLDTYVEHNGIQNLAYHVHYSITTTDTESVYKVIQNMTHWLPFEEPAFAVPASQLTEQQIVDYIKSQVVVADLEQAGEQQLQEMKTPTITTIPLPWKTTEELFEEKKNEFTWHVQHFMDQQASLKGYDNILSACSYAAYPNAFQQESQSFILWRSAVWTYCYQELQKIQNNERSIPAVEDFIAELPAFVNL